MRNRKLNKNSKSGFPGVYWNSREEKWRSHIKDKNRNIHLGYFSSLDEATAARIGAEQQIGFHINHGR